MFVYGVDIPLHAIEQPDKPARPDPAKSPVLPSEFSFMYGKEIFTDNPDQEE